MTVLVTAPFSDAELARLRMALKCEVLRSATATPELSELEHARAMIIRSSTKVDDYLLTRAPHLKLIVTATSGYDHIDLGLCEQRRIRVLHTPDANFESAAQHTMQLMLQLAGRGTFAQEAVKKNDWRQGLTRGLELSGKTLGLIGLGRVGGRVAELAKAFGMNVMAYDPFIETERFSKLSVKPMGFTELLYQAHFLSLHVPLTEKTRHLINHRTLQMLDEEAYLINTSRGPVIDEDELAKALFEGRLKGAALDVFEIEPLAKDSVLRGLPNVILTPHIGAHTEEAWRKGAQLAVDHVIRFFQPDALPTSWTDAPGPL